MWTSNSLILVADDVLDHHFALASFARFLRCHVGFWSDVILLRAEFPLLWPFPFVLGLGPWRKLIEWRIL
jgi:hypothetical protein